jgi:hypothetical protein
LLYNVWKNYTDEELSPRWLCDAYVKRTGKIIHLTIADNYLYSPPKSTSTVDMDMRLGLRFSKTLMLAQKGHLYNYVSSEKKFMVKVEFAIAD